MVSKIKKIFRYTISGYLWKRNAANKQMENFYADDLHIKGTKYDKPVAVYTSVYGNYDSIKEPHYMHDSIHYYVLTDQDISKESAWEKIDINTVETEQLNGKDKSRYFKMHPEILFPEYEFSLYIDGNVEINGDFGDIISYMEESGYIFAMNRHSIRDCIYDEANAVIAFGLGSIRDVKRMMHRYRKEGFPTKYGLFDNCIIFRKHNSPLCKAVMNMWWKEYSSNSCKRDQLSFCYCLWKNGLKFEDVLIIGSNAYKNPKFIIQEHSSKVRCNE